MNLGATIKERDQVYLQDHAKALIFLHHHIHEDLKNKYLMVKNPFTLWNDLRERYDY